MWKNLIKNLWKCIFRTSWRVSFSYFPKFALDNVGGEHSLCALFVMFLIIVTWRFFINVIGFLDLTLKCIDKFRLRQYSITFTIYMFKVIKKHKRATCQIYSKLVIKTLVWHLILLLLTLNILHSHFNLLFRDLLKQF